MSKCRVLCFKTPCTLKVLNVQVLANKIILETDEGIYELRNRLFDGYKGWARFVTKCCAFIHPILPLLVEFGLEGTRYYAEMLNDDGSYIPRSNSVKKLKSGLF
jgi:hypothetical protein